MSPPAKKATKAELVKLKGASLKSMSICNLRCIDPTPVVIDLDDIVVLVGPNNVGKSTILLAYELVMGHGGGGGELKEEDFPNLKIDEDNKPEIVVETYLGEGRPGEEWVLKEKGTEREYIRERLVWSNTGKAERHGFNARDDDWSDKVPWGAPNVAKSNRPDPVRVKPFASPDDQVKAIGKLLKAEIKARQEDAKYDGKDISVHFDEIVDTVKKLRTATKKAAQESIDSVEKALTDIVEKIFPGNVIKVDACEDEALSIDKILFANTPELLMGPENGFQSKLHLQGSGARRTLLWSILKLITETPKKTKKKKVPVPEDKEEGTRGAVLLIDEPEICLHPHAIREACQVLYDLAEAENEWQVMITTHSPIFIDLSRDNTTVVRVERNEGGEVTGTTVFRPTDVKLTDDDRDMLKLLNLWDPYVAEFFFGGKCVVVEGDTEYSVFKYLIAEDPSKYGNVHIIRARGKEIIVPLVKILNHFASDYSVLHDSDKPKTAKGNDNTAWSANERIKDAVDGALKGCSIRMVACKVDFENAILETKASNDKPYKAVTAIKDDEKARERVIALLDSLLDHEKDVPDSCLEWSSLEELQNFVEPVD